MQNEYPLSKRLYEETKSIHEQVESMPFVLAFRENNLSKEVYIHYLADLRVVYQALENAMRENLKQPTIKILYDEPLCRTRKLETDLKSFEAENCTPTEAAQDYVRHLKSLSTNTPFLLLAHAYVRYLGDLSGGRMMKKFVEQAFPGDHVAFYNFDELLGPKALGAQFVDYKNGWKKRLDNLNFSDVEQKSLIEEAKMAFEYAGRMFQSYVITK